MGLVRLAVERPVATVLLSLAIIFAGFFGYRQFILEETIKGHFADARILANLLDGDASESISPKEVLGAVQ